MDTFNNPNNSLDRSILNKAREYAQQNVLVILLAVAVVSLGSAYYFYGQYSSLKNTDKVVQEENDKLIAQIDRLIVLPEGETPTVGTVADSEKLRNQPFFAKAQKGDRVLIYAKAHKAILYNPSTNKIVEVTSVNTGP